MKKLEDFVIEISEQRGRPRKNANSEATNKPEDRVVAKPEDARTLEAIRGLTAEENDSGGVWDIDPPTEDDILKGIDRSKLTENKKDILMRMKQGKPFFVQGEAGWAKTSVITKLAKQCKRVVLTVYLDKAEATDLGGLPVPTKSKRGADSVKHLMPEWAAVMWDNPDVNFLLFFDEMNQATPDVTSALMPIVLKNVICGRKFKNFVVGAAGNLEEENPDAIYEIGKPLLSRFGGIIKWEKDWDDSIDYLKGKWKDKLSDKFLNGVFKYKDIFANPRDLESFVIETVYRIREDEDYDLYDVNDYKRAIRRVAKSKLTRSEEDRVEELAELCYNYIMNAEKVDNSRESGDEWDISMVKPNVLNAIKRAMADGYIRAGGVNYGVSKENISSIVDPKVCNREMLERIISKNEIDGIKWKYETDEEWKRAGYKEVQNFIINTKYKPAEEPTKSTKTKKSHTND